MPIKGLTETRRMPRLGKIHLGIKVTNKGGVEYPQAVDYFVVPPEVAEVYGEKPKELSILIPTEDDAIWASQYYRSYSRTRGLVCRGDGETCSRMTDTSTGKMANRDTKEIEWKTDLPCTGRDCPFYKDKKCKEVMNLQFLLPDVPGLGVWQVDTSSINSIRNINSAAELIRGICGRVSMLPLTLTLEPVEVNNPDTGKKKNVHVLNLRHRQALRDLLSSRLKPAPELLVAAPSENDAPLDEQEPEVVEEPGDPVDPDGLFSKGEGGGGETVSATTEGEESKKNSDVPAARRTSDQIKEEDVPDGYILEKISNEVWGIQPKQVWAECNYPSVRHFEEAGVESAWHCYLKMKSARG